MLFLKKKFSSLFESNSNGIERPMEKPIGKMIMLPPVGCPDILDKLYLSSCQVGRDFRLLSIENDGYKSKNYKNRIELPQLPPLIWSHILNFLVYHYLPNKFVFNLEKNINFEYILKLSLVCKTWSNSVIPNLHFGCISIYNADTLIRLNQLTKNGITGRPVRFSSIEYAFRQPWSLPHNIKNSAITSSNAREISFNFDSNDNHTASYFSQVLARSSKLETVKFSNSNGGFLIKGMVSFIPRTISTLDIGSNRLGGDIVKNLGPLIGANGWLENLNIENNCLGASGCKSLAILLRVNKSLKSLNLSFNLLMDDVEDIAFALLTDNRTLTHLNLNENGIGELGGKAIAQMIMQNTSLESLILDTNKFGELSLAGIVESISFNKKLKKVSLAMIGNLGGQQVANFIESSPNLENLNLMVNEFGQSDSQVFSALTKHRNIDSVNLSYTKIRSQAAKDGLKTMIEENQIIKRLNLSYVFLDSNVTDIISALLFNNTLTEIDLSLNSIESYHGEIIGSYLLTNKSLTSLNLGGNILGTAGTVAILKSLIHNDTLKTLNLRKNQMKSIEPNLFFNVLCNNNTLTYLDLYQNSLTTKLGHEISCGLAVNHALTHIDLSCNEFGVECAPSFQQALTNNNTLRYINLIGNGFGRELTIFLHTAFDEKFEQFRIENGNTSVLKPAIKLPKEEPVSVKRNFDKKNFFRFFFFLKQPNDIPKHIKVNQWVAGVSVAVVVMTYLTFSFLNILYK